MPYRIETTDQYVLIEHHGELTLEDIEAARAPAMREVAAHDKPILVDITAVTNRLASSELKQSMAGHKQAGMPRPHAALLGRADQQELLAVIESLAVSHGMPIRAFTERKAALEWLMA